MNAGQTDPVGFDLHGHLEETDSRVGQLKGRITIDTAEAEMNIRALTRAIQEFDAVRRASTPEWARVVIALLMLAATFMLGVAWGSIRG